MDANTDTVAQNGRFGRNLNRFALGVALLVGSMNVACQTKPAPDNRPGWILEAEARLQQPPSWQVSGSGVDSGRGSQPQSSFFGSGQAATSSNDRQSGGASSGPTTAGNAATRVAEPPGVQWSETKITVSVED